MEQRLYANSAEFAENLAGIYYDRKSSEEGPNSEKTGGSITKDEYENLHDYLYLPYQELGGNGTAEKIMKEVSNLPIK